MVRNKKRMLMCLPSPYDRKRTKERTIEVVQGDSVEFLLRTVSQGGTIANTATHDLVIKLADGTQQTPILWEGDWGDTKAHNTEHEEGLYKVTIPKDITYNLRSGGYSLSAAIIDVGVDRIETVASGYLYIDALPTSNVRLHRDR